MDKEYKSLNSVLDKVYKQRKEMGKHTDEADPEDAKKRLSKHNFFTFQGG